MVHEDWIESKILQFERDRTTHTWTEIREQQLRYLYEMYRTGRFATATPDQINSRLIEIFHGTDD